MCAVAVGLVGDVCRAIEASVQPHCDKIVTLLLQNLTNPNLNRCVKPPTLAVFGDIALAIGPAFAPYFETVMEMLRQAAATTVPAEDEDLVEYLNQLREPFCSYKSSHSDNHITNSMYF